MTVYSLCGGASAMANTAAAAAPYELKAGGGQAALDEAQSYTSLAHRIQSIAIEMIATTGAFLWGITRGIALTIYHYKSIAQGCSNGRQLFRQLPPSDYQVFKYALENIRDMSIQRYKEIKSCFTPVEQDGSGF